MDINEQANAIFNSMGFDVRLNRGMRGHIAAVFEVAALAFDEPLDLDERALVPPPHMWPYLDEAFQDGISGAGLSPEHRRAWADAYAAARRVMQSEAVEASRARGPQIG